MNSIRKALKRVNRATQIFKRTPGDCRAVQLIMVIHICFCAIVFVSPQSHAAVSQDLGGDFFGTQRSSDATSSSDVLFRGGLLAFKAGKFEEAQSVWQYTARLGDKSSQYLLGRMYQHGWGVKANAQRAFALHISAAMQGVPAAEFQLGTAFFQIGSYQNAMQWWAKAASAGYSPAQYNLGLVNLYGLGVEKNAETAMTWLNRAAHRGSALAQYYLGVMYLKGEGVDQDRDMAMSWLERSASNGYKAATADIDTIATATIQPVLAK